MCVHNDGHGHNAGYLCLFCVPLVCFLRKSTEFHDMRTECQRILIHFLLLIYHKYAVCTKRTDLFYSSSISIAVLLRCWHA